MSQKIAPGRWEATTRKLAKVVTFVVGIVLIVVGLGLANALVGAVREGTPITIWSLLLVMVPLGAGLSATFPAIITPIIYRVLDRFAPSKD